MPATSRMKAKCLYSACRWPPGHAACGLALMGILLLLVYWPGFSGVWILDDFRNIHSNPNVHADDLTWESLRPAIYGFSQGGRQLQRPVSYLTLAANYALGGTDPLGYHIVNWLIHLLSAVAVYLLARITLSLPAMAGRCGGNVHGAALLGALLWAVHPIQVTAVTYIVQRMAALAALFSFSAMICYAKGRVHPRWPARIGWYALCTISCVLAFGSKQNAVMLPVSLFLYDRCFLASADRGTGFPRMPILAALVTLICAAAFYYGGVNLITSGYDTRPFTLPQRALTEPRVLWLYLWMLFIPRSDRFTLLHDVALSRDLMTPWTTLPAVVGLSVLTILSVLIRRKYPLAAFAWLFFIANHAVESSVLPLELMFEHRNYLPTAFIFIWIGTLFTTTHNTFRDSHLVRGMLILTGIVTIVSLGHTSYMRNRLFVDDIAFWSDNAEKSPELHRPWHNLGVAYFKAREWSSAIAATEYSMDKKILARTPQKYVSHLNLAKFYYLNGDAKRSIQHYRMVLQLKPNHPEALNGLAEVYLSKGDLERAGFYNTRALHVTPAPPEILLTRSRILLRQGDAAPAFGAAARFLGQAPDNPMALFVMGRAAQMRGHEASAKRFFHQALALKPDFNAAALALMDIAVSQGDPDAVCDLHQRMVDRDKGIKIGRLAAAYHDKYGSFDEERRRALSAVTAQCREMVRRH